MEIKTYPTLPKEAADIRIAVFVDEQGFQEEFDDADKTCIHLVAFDGDTALGTCRYHPYDDKGCYLIGRIAVSRTHRGRGIGGMLVTEAERQIKALGGTRTHIGAQVRAMPFYASLGYIPVGDRYMDEHVEHQGMEKDLV